MKENYEKNSNQEKESSAKSIVVSAKDLKSCPICLTAISNRALTDTCSHEFCFECISQWSTNHNRCPICRQTYTNIKYNIVSDQTFEQMVVAQQPEANDEEEIAAILRRMLLYLRVIGLRNRTQRRREQMFEDLNQLQESNVRATEEFRQQIQDMRQSLRQMDEDIHRFNQTLGSENPTEEELNTVLNGREDEISDIEVIDIIFEPELLQFEANVETDAEDYESVESLPSLISEEDSGNESDDELEEDIEEEVEDEEEVEPINTRNRRNRRKRQNSENSRERPPKRRRRN